MLKQEGTTLAKVAKDEEMSMELVDGAQSALLATASRRAAIRACHARIICEPRAASARSIVQYAIAAS